MPINHEDGKFCLEIFESKPHDEYCDDLPELRARAETLITAGRFKYLKLWMWDDALEDWKEIEEIEPD